MDSYKIYINNGSEDLKIYEVGDPDLVLSDVHYRPHAGSAGELTFTINQLNPYFTKINPLTTLFKLYKNNVLEFIGRYVGSEVDYNKSGAVTVEGDLNFFIDSVQDPFEYTGNCQTLFARLISNHNGMVDAYKRFTAGMCNVGTSISMQFETFASTLDIMKEMHNQTDGLWRVRHVNGVNYIDFVTDYGGTNPQPIRFGENLIDLSKSIDCGSICTCFIPVGAQYEEQTAAGTVSKRVLISSVNGGLNYITSDVGIEKWGRIWGTHIFENADTPSKLLTMARKYLTEHVSLPETINLTAMDLSLIDANYEGFKVGYWTNVESEFHNISAQYLLKEADINISDPSQSTITLGGYVQTMTGMTAKALGETSRAVEALAASTNDEINSKVENATQLITGGLGGYVVIGRDNSDHPEEILIMDRPDKRNAVNVIRLNKNGIGFSNSGYNGTYRNAWTIDGNLVADFITTGQMSADRIRGGSLEVGGTGTGKNGSIVVKGVDNSIKASIDKNGVNVYGGTISGGTISGGTVSGATVTGTNIKGSTIEGTSIKGGTISGNTITGSNISGGTVKGTTISGGTISGTTVSGGTVSGTNISGGSIDVGAFHAEGSYVTFGDFYSAGDRTHELRTDDNSIIIFSAQHDGSEYGVPGGVPAVIVGGSTRITDSEVYADSMSADEYYVWGWQNGLAYWVDWLYEQVMSL